MIRFRLKPDDGEYMVEVLDPELQSFADFVNFDLFGRQGVESQLEIARAVLAGKWTEKRGSARQPTEEYIRGHNAHHVVITPVTTTIAREDEATRSEAPTPDYVRFLEDLLTETAHDA